MNAERYTELSYLLRRRHLRQTDVAELAGCTSENIRQFLEGRHNSLLVGRAMAAITEAPRRISAITGIPVEKLTDDEAA